MTSLLDVNRLNRSYGGHCAVQDLGFTLKKGEILGFLGPNGAGKTTTLKMISGDLAPNSGQILINGIDLQRQPGKAKRFLGYLPDNPPLYRDSTVDEYLRFCAKIHQLKGTAIADNIDRVKQQCGLCEVGTRLIRNLSKGFQQRIGMAQAILHSPPVMIFDEPMVGLDPIQIREVRELIRNLGQNHAVILSSHILAEVQNTCTRALIIHQGRMLLDTDIQALEETLQDSSLILQTRDPLVTARVEEIDGVESVESLPEHCYRIIFKKNCNPAERVSEVVVRAGWGLRQLRHESGSIEKLFLDLTRNEVGTMPESVQ